jgi:hypothetical protein
MSMYTQLLHAAFGQRAPVMVRSSKRSALEAVRRSRGELEEKMPPRTDPDAVPVVLVRQIGYDVALLELAALLGVESDPSPFEPPLHERSRLEQAFRHRGIALQTPIGSGDAASAPA